MSNERPFLSPQQLCFVVEDVAASVDFAVKHYGWGPFFSFSAPVPGARYKDWQGHKHTDVALGMAGEVQIEFIRVLEGHDTVGDYQQRYGNGLQHIGVRCKDRDEAVNFLKQHGCEENERNEFPGIQFAFMNLPTGEGMFELLQPTQEEKSVVKDAKAKNDDSGTNFPVDRVTIVSQNFDRDLAYYCEYFGWDAEIAQKDTLILEGREIPMRRALAKAGTLDIELLEPPANDENPYSQHLAGRPHGLVHGGAIAKSGSELEPAIRGEWKLSGERFGLYHWPDLDFALQIREP